MIQDCKKLISFYEQVINENNNNIDVGYITWVKIRLENESQRLKLILETGI
jgi:hypothetical protein